MSFFAPGTHIALREMWHGKVWFASPQIVVEDNEECTVLFTRAGAVGKAAARETYEEGIALLVQREWELTDRVYHSTRRLGMSRPGDRYCVSGFWNDSDASFLGWYVDMVDPFVRTEVGFDFRDLELDIVISPDLSSWQWKDQEALDMRVDAGLHTPDEAAEIRRVGEEVIVTIERGDAWWMDRLSFVPDLPAPGLPRGWDSVVVAS